MATTPPTPSLPPTPDDPVDARRWEHTRMLYRMLYGLWRGDLKARVTLLVGAERSDAWGHLDQSTNVALGSTSALSTQYDRDVCVECDDAEGYDDPDELIEEIADTGIWSLKQRYQRDLIGMREALIAIDIIDGRIVYRKVTPDYVTAKSHPRDPSRPIEIHEAREIERVNGTPGKQWVWDRWSANGLEVVEADGTKSVLETRPPWVYADGSPFLPYVLDHAAVTGQLWDAYASIELFDGALTAAVFRSFFGHGFLDASWPQRWLLNCEPVGAAVEGDANGRRRTVVSDPSTAVMLAQLAEATGQPSVGQWQPGCDIGVLWDACAQFERSVAASAGISPSDIQRIAGDPRSGMSLAITREAQREAQRRFAPILRPGDEELIGKTAAMVNRVRGTNYPESGYRVIYGAIPPSAEEVTAAREQADWEAANGIVSKTSVYMRLHPGIDDESAADKIVEIALSNMALEKRIAAEAEAIWPTPNLPPPPKVRPSMEEAAAEAEPEIDDADERAEAEEGPPSIAS